MNNSLDKIGVVHTADMIARAESVASSAQARKDVGNLCAARTARRAWELMLRLQGRRKAELAHITGERIISS